MQEKIFLSASDWWLLGEKIWEKEQLKNVMSCMSERFQEQWVLYCEEVAVISKDDFLFICIYRGELLLAILTFFYILWKKDIDKKWKKKSGSNICMEKNDNLYKWSLLNSSTYKLFLHLKIEIKKLRRKCNKKREM